MIVMIDDDRWLIRGYVITVPMNWDFMFNQPREGEDSWVYDTVRIGNKVQNQLGIAVDT